MIIAPVGLSKNFQYDCLINTLLTNKRENIFWYHHKTGSCSSVHQGWADNPYTGQTIDEPLQCAEEYCREWSKWDTDTVIDWCGCWCCSRVTCGRQFLHCHCFHWSTTTRKLNGRWLRWRQLSGCQAKNLKVTLLMNFSSVQETSFKLQSETIHLPAIADISLCIDLCFLLLINAA